MRDSRSERPSAPIIDSDHPAVREFSVSRIRDAGAAGGTPREKAIALYYAVRDEIRYDPHGAGVSAESLRASATLEREHGWCVSKAVLLAAVCRAAEIPARLGFADVRNHLSTARMREHMQTDVFYWHGYTTMRLGETETWVKATPAFNIELCERFGFLPLEFDGWTDSLYHPFDREGRQHMEYVHERGEFEDVPLDAILETFASAYPGLSFEGRATDSAFGSDADFDRDVEAEVAGSDRPERSALPADRTGS
ncbi:MAG: transglutaminase-like domain-containing protein [bacterium]